MAVPDSLEGTTGIDVQSYYKGTDGRWYTLLYGRNGNFWRANGAEPGFPYKKIDNPPADAPASPSSTTAPSSSNTSLLTPALKPKGSTSSSSLRYPDDIAVTGESHYVLFTFKKYTPPFSKTAQSSVGSSATAVTAYNAQTNNLEDSGLPQVLLYMPEGVAASYKTNWDGKAFGNVAAGMLRTAGQVANNDYLKALSSISSTAEQTLKNASATLGAKGVSALIKAATKDSIGVQDIFSSIGGAILNPNVELIFGGSELRTLQLTFKMVPYNKTEAQTIDKIVKTFKEAMLPKLNLGESGEFWGILSGTNKKESEASTAYGSGFIGVPDLVQISFMRGGTENNRVSKYKVCSITDFDVNYSPDGVYAVGPDGYPVATEIRVNFMETKLVYKEDIDSGY
jgi:hypothetical protein